MRIYTQIKGCFEKETYSLLTLTLPKTIILRTASFSYVSENQFKHTPSNYAGVCLQNTYDYSPFGVSLDGRTMEGDFYRRGYNGMEKDTEIFGLGNNYSTFFRQLDPRVGRWYSLDPKATEWESPYVSMRDNPLNGTDPDGAWFKSSQERQAKIFARKTGGKYSTTEDENGKVTAYVTIVKMAKEGSGIRDKDGISSIEEVSIINYVFKEGKDRSDLLMDAGVGFYEANQAAANGWERIEWFFKSGDAWAKGQGEFGRNGQAPTVAKVVAGLTPIISVPNSISVLSSDKDLYGQSASTQTDKILALFGLIDGLGGFSKFSTFVNANNKIIQNAKKIDVLNKVVQGANDTGALEVIK